MSWEKRWEGPGVAIQWIQLLVQKKISLTGWTERASKGCLLEGPLNLSDLFNPGTFLNALRQQSARRLSIPIEETKLVTAWDKSRISGDFVVQADGLFVESADIDRHLLHEVEPTAPELARAPGLYLCFVPIRDVSI